MTIEPVWGLRHDSRVAFAFRGDVMTPMRKIPVVVSVVIGAALFNLDSQVAYAQFTQTNLSSDISGAANFTDPNLKDPRGLAATASSPFWTANAAAGNSTLHFGNGSLAPNPVTPLIVAIPQGAPTGTVSLPGVPNPNVFNGDVFFFATSNGQLAGWRGALGTTAETLSLGTGGTYTGLAAASIGSNTYLYASDFRNGSIDVFPSAGAPVLPGTFTDPNLPAGYAPFNIQALNGLLFVTYGLQDAVKTSAVSGLGFGFVDMFNLDGTLISRLITQGVLNAPWGLAIAPNGFGSLGGDLLVGNHGDGTIWAFNFNDHSLTQLKDAQGNPIVNPGLWALMFGNSGNGFDANTLYLTAGLNGGVNGLFAEIQSATPIPAALPLFATGLGALGLFGWRRKRKQAA